MRRSVGLASVLLGTAACQPTSDDWLRTLQTQAQMPRCDGARADRTASQDMGQDYSNTIAVQAPPGCVARWREVLAASRDYECAGPVSCTRFVTGGRFDEEYATVSFVARDRVQVILTKI